MHSTTALRAFRSKALDDEGFSARYGWGGSGHSEEAVKAIWAELADLVPAGATHVLDLGCGNGGFAKVLRKKHPGVAITAVDLVIENIEEAQANCKADGTITVASVTASDTVSINGVTITASGAQTPSGLNFDEAAGSDVDVASSLVAAINDSGNGLNAVVTADNAGGTSAVVTVTAVVPGAASNSMALVSSNGTRLAVEAATLTGGVDPADFKVEGVWDALMEESPAWDFVVSCNCVWAYTESRLMSKPGAFSPMETLDPRTLLFDLLNAKATKGFAILGRRGETPRKLATLMANARAASTGLADSYYVGEGAPSTLAPATVSLELVPIWLQRDGVTGVTAPEVPSGLCLTADATLPTYNREVSSMDRRRAAKAGDPAPTTFKGLAAGRVVAPSLPILGE